MYDCVHMTTSTDVRAENDILHINIIENKMNLNDKRSNMQQPKRNGIGMTSNEYREFLEDLSFTTSELKKWLNDVVLRGDRIKFPFKRDQIMSSLKFEN